MKQQAQSGLCPAADFPITKRLTYLNSAGLGIVPIPVQRRALDFAQRLATEGTRAYFENAADVRLAPRIAAARLLNADSASIAIVNSVSEVMNQFAWWVRPGRRQNVVTIDIDHPSATFPWLRVAEETGAEVRFVRAANAPGDLAFADIAALVDDGTAVISVSHVLWTTGLRFDLRALADLAHTHGALLTIDATHSAGVIPLDAPASGADLIAAGAFKWLCGFSGSAICYIKPDIIDQIRPILVGHNNGTATEQLRPEAYDACSIELPTNARRMEYGSSAHVPRFMLGPSIDYLLDVGIHRIEDHVQMLGTHLIEGLLQLGAQILTPLDARQRGGIITARFAGHDGAALTATLDRQDVVVLPRLGGIRFSPHLFNSVEDIDRAVAAVAVALAR
jgi:cysteine desulfurase / selenocysteine lyase